jgi:hypothetical protein
MSTSHNSLIDALEGADMLEIDGLHAWQFSLDNELLAQVSAGSAGADSNEQTLLTIECIDGRVQRKWQFSLAAVMAARFDAQSDSWLLADAAQQHRIHCFDAIRGSNDEAEADASNDA